MSNAVGDASDDLSTLLEETRNHPNYLGNINFSSESHTALFHSGPRIKFVSTTATGNDAQTPLTGVVIAKILDHNSWYNPEGTWGRPGITQQFPVPVSKSQIRFLICGVDASDGSAFEDVVSDQDYDHLVSNIKKLQERSFDVFKKTLKKPEFRLPFSKGSNFVSVGHKLLVVSNLYSTAQSSVLTLTSGPSSRR